MVSLRELERNGVLAVLPVNQIPWESIRSTLEFGLTSKGVEPGRAEEYAADAICHVLGGIAPGEHVSAARIRKDCRQHIGTVRHNEYLQSQELKLQTIDDYEPTIDKRLSLLGSVKESTAVNDEMAERRETRELFAWFSRKYFPLEPGKQQLQSEFHPVSWRIPRGK